MTATVPRTSAVPSAVGRVVEWVRAEWPVVMVLVISVAAAFVTGNGSRSDFAMPRVVSGDEPHYVVMLSSLVEDQDFSLRNNHREVWKGGDEAGASFRGYPLGPHSAYYTADGRYLTSLDVYDTENWILPNEPPLFEGVDPAIDAMPWYSWHGYGLPMATAPFAWALQPLLTVEQVAILFNACLVAVCYWLMRRIVRQLDFGPWSTRYVPVLACLATPLWFYGHHYFAEAMITTIVLAVTTLLLDRRHCVWIGLLIGLGIVAKTTVGVIALPILAFAAWERRWRDAAMLCAGMLPGVAVQLYMQQHMFGGITNTGVPFFMGNPITASFGALFSWTYGMLFFAPIAIVAAFGLPRLARDRRTWQPLAMGAAYFLLNALWWVWGGGWGYGPRLFVPVIPLMLLGLNGIEARGYRRTPVWPVITAVAVVSVMLQASAHFQGQAAWGVNPLEPFVDVVQPEGG